MPRVLDAMRLAEKMQQPGRFVFDLVSPLDYKQILYGKGADLAGAQMPAAHVAGLIAGTWVPRSTVKTVQAGRAPDGFGAAIDWSPEDETLAVVMYVSGADQTGVIIEGFKAGDTMQITEASGTAWFSKGIANQGIASVVGILAAGAGLAGETFGLKGVKSVVDAVDAWAKDMWPETPELREPRDAFGMIPGPHEMARQEGGVLVSLPVPPSAVLTTFQSGDNDHEEFWIRKPGTRVAANYPPQIPAGRAKFLTGDDALFKAAHDGAMMIYPWDWAFPDNSGYYRLKAILKHGGDGEVVIE